MSDSFESKPEYRFEEFIYSDKQIEEHKTQIFNKLSKVTPQLFAEFMATRGASTTCISCGSRNLSVPETLTFVDNAIPEGFGAMTPAQQVAVIKKAKRINVVHYLIGNPSVPLLSDFEFRVNCANCGHVSLYRAHPIVQWIEEQEEDVSK